MEEQKIDQAVIDDYGCEYCHDTGIINGWADLDGERVMLLRLCKCEKGKNVKKDEVQYDF